MKNTRKPATSEELLQSLDTCLYLYYEEQNGLSSGYLEDAVQRLVETYEKTYPQRANNMRYLVREKEAKYHAQSAETR